MIDNSGIQHARGCLIVARECLRADSKQMATYQAVDQTQSRCQIAYVALSRTKQQLKRRVAAGNQIYAAQLLHKLGLLTSLARSYTLSTMHQ